jgi:hypothetical protein
MIYHCDKKGHGAKHLLTRREKLIGPEGAVEYCYVETCPQCIIEAVRNKELQIKRLVEGS